MPEITAPTLTDADLAALRDGAGAACGFLRALAHEDRLMLLCQLSRLLREFGNRLRNFVFVAEVEI